jgi:hypothetical protein
MEKLEVSLSCTVAFACPMVRPRSPDGTKRNPGYEAASTDRKADNNPAKSAALMSEQRLFQGLNSHMAILFTPAHAGFVKQNLPVHRHSVCLRLCNASIEIRMDAAPEPPRSLTRA